MTPTRWQQVKGVLGDALDCADTAERSAFVRNACAEDTALLREVESLLHASSDKLESVAQEMRVTTAEASDPSIGRRIGAYQIVRELGRGGMGAVYLAERADEEFQKQVAIKLLKRGTDTDEVLRRFRAEREILARLDHPNIARLLDAGTAEEGLPYFVMEYVVGARVTDYCFAERLSVSDRLELFLKICGAVQFAHQNLVIHRDLKPANILITAEGEPKLLDFGIAKLVAADGGAFHATVPDQQRLTPAYASPEQVRGDVITTVSDVYTLGVLLYELLVGHSPHKFAAAHPSATELWRVVGEETPARPSLAPREAHLRRRLRGDLDNILLTALRKEPARRYSGVGAFAEDVRRHLNDRPVRARPATWSYRAAKFVSRNKAATVAGTLAVVALLGGTTISIWNARRARMEAHRAERNFQDVRRLANSFLFEFHDAIATLPGTTAARQLVVSRALEYLDKLAREAARDPRLQMELANAYLKIGDVQGKPYTANLGDTEGAIGSYSRAAEIAAPLAEKEKGSARSDARRVVSSAYASLATVQARSNQLGEATQNNERALQIGERLLLEDARHADDWRRLVISCHLGLGDAIQAGNHTRRDSALHRDALEHYRRALPLAEALVAANPASAEDVHRFARATSRTAAIVAELGAQSRDAAMFDESLKLHRRTVELYSGLAEQYPQNVQYRRNIADGLVMMAYARLLAGRDLEAGLGEIARALEIENALAAADPSNAEAQQDLSFAHLNAARLSQAIGEMEGAAQHYRACLDILEPLVRRHPDNVETAFDLERARAGLAKVAPD